MAVPAAMTTLDLSGRYVQNKRLSDDIGEILALQGVDWFTRRILMASTVWVAVSHTKEHGVERLTVRQVLTLGMKYEDVQHIFDGRERANSVLSNTGETCRRVRLGELDDGHLKNGWASVSKRYGVLKVHSENGETRWSSDTIWGLENIDGQLRHVRRISMVGPKGARRRARLVFDYIDDQHS